MRPESLTITKDVSPAERQIAILRLGGATIDAIALVCKVSAETIRGVLERSHVQDFVDRMSVLTATNVEESVDRLNKRIEDAATEAFDVEMLMMRRMKSLSEMPDDIKPSDVIKAQLGAASIAQDILDRAGKRAPTKVVTANLRGELPAEHVERLVNVARELKEHRMPELTIVK